MTHWSPHHLIRSLGGSNVVVIGDICLDEYLIGRPERLSREAPVPVLELARRQVVPGAAANPARNVRSLGSAASLVGVIGDDDSGRELLATLKDEGIDTRSIVIEPGRQTSVKTRVLADSDYRFFQHLVRLDRGSRDPLRGETREAVLRAIESRAADADVLLVSDYRSGVMDAEVIDTVGTLAKRLNKPVAVDSQGDLFRFAGYTLIRSNRAEAEASVRRALQTEEDFAEATRELRDSLGASAVVITLGRDGLAVRGPSSFAVIPAANRSEVFDAVGAGDTVIAVLALALACGADVVEGARMANTAAGIVVRRFGNAVTTQTELLAALIRPTT